MTFLMGLRWQSLLVEIISCCFGLPAGQWEYDHVASPSTSIFNPYLNSGIDEYTSIR